MKHYKVASLVVYAIACCIPALEWHYSNKPVEHELGIHTLAVGWSGIFAGVVPWYANLFWMLSLLINHGKRRKLGLVIDAAACLLALTTFYYVGKDLPGDEGGVTHATIARMLPGSFVWIASIVLLPVAGWFTTARRRAV